VAEQPDIAIIGPGKVGQTLGVLAARAGWRVAAVAGRARRRALAAAEAIGPDVRACTPLQAARAAGLVLLTVPDAAIRPLCEQLAARKAFRRGTVVAHCSGALSSDELAAARDRCGCSAGSMHPLQTFPTVEAAEARLPGATCFLEGDAPAVEALSALAGAVGCQAVRMQTGEKALYHAAAVLACNYVTALLDAASAAAEAAGVGRGAYLAAAEPMVRATVDNLFALGPAAALTGPVARGDAETVARHLAALMPLPPALEALYRAAGRWTVDLARKKGTIDDTTADALRKLLNPRARKE